MYGMTPMGVFFTAIFPLQINEQALCQQLRYDAKPPVRGIMDSAVKKLRKSEAL